MSTQYNERLELLFALRERAEEDTVRAVLSTVLTSGEATDKFSGWVLAAAGGFVALQFSVAATVVPRAPYLMLTSIVLTVLSLFIGTIVRLIVYTTDLAKMTDGIVKGGKEVKDAHDAKMSELLQRWDREGSFIRPDPVPLDSERIDKNVKTLTDLKQRWLPHMMFEAADKLVGVMIPKPLPPESVDEVFEGLDLPVRLATAAQYWSVVQLIVMIFAVGVGAVAYGIATLHAPPVEPKIGLYSPG